MNIASCVRYQKRAGIWIKIFAVFVSLFSSLLLLLRPSGDAALIGGIIGITLSLTGILTAWLFKKYYQEYETVLVEFEKLPSLASWKVPHSRWNDYQRVEKAHRKREFLKYLLWSPLLIAFIGIMIWAEIDELDFDANLILWGVGGYTFMMILLYVQMKLSLKKVQSLDEHTIVLKSVGACVDDHITFWGKITAESHDSLGKSLQALLFAKSDSERKVNQAYIHLEDDLAYLVVNFNQDENNQKDIFLPLPEDHIKAVTEKLDFIKSDTVFQHPAASLSKAKYDTKKYLKWMVTGAALISAGLWIYEKGLPLYHQYEAEQLFDEGVALYNEGSYEQAKKKYRASLKENPDLAEAYLNLGTTYMNQGELDSALFYYDLTLEKSPDYDLALFNKGVVLYNRNEYRSMLNLYYQYEKVTDNHDHDLMMGDAFYHLNLPDSALMYYQRAEMDDKKSSALSYMIGLIMMKKENWHNAATHLEMAVHQDSTLADGYLLLSEVYQKMGDANLADQHYKKGMHLQSLSE